MYSLECKVIRSWFNVLDAASPSRSNKRGNSPESSRFNKQWRPKIQSCKTGGLSCEVRPLLETWCHHVAWPQGQRGRFWLTAIGQCPVKSHKSHEHLLQLTKDVSSVSDTLFGVKVNFKEEKRLHRAKTLISRINGACKAKPPLAQLS